MLFLVLLNIVTIWGAVPVVIIHHLWSAMQLLQTGQCMAIVPFLIALSAKSPSSPDFEIDFIDGP